MHIHTLSHIYIHACTDTSYADIPLSYEYEELPERLDTGLLSTLGPETPSCRWVSHISSVGDGIPPSVPAPEAINLVTQIASDSSGMSHLSILSLY